MSLWLVQVNQQLLTSELENALFQRLTQLSRVRPDQRVYYVMDDKEETRQMLIEIDQDQIVKREIPVMPPADRLFVGGDKESLEPGARTLFAAMVLPRIEIQDRSDLGSEIEVVVRLRDLTFLVIKGGDYDLFEYQSKLPWRTYVQEFGDQPATLRIQPASIRERTSYEVLDMLLSRIVEQRVQNELAPDDAHLYGDTFLLNNSLLGKLPRAMRDLASAITDDVTRMLDDTKRFGTYETNWKAAHVYSVLRISAKSIEIARHRPRAAAEADRLIPFISDRLVTVSERWDFIEYVKKHLYGFFPPYFEVLLDELKRRDGGKWFRRFFEAVKEAKDYQLRLDVIRNVKETIYANDPAVLDLIDHHNRIEHTRVTGDVYDAANQRIILNKLFGDATVSVNQILYEVWDSYIHEDKRYKPKSKFQQEWERQLLTEALALIGRIAKGEDSQALQNGYTEEQFAEEILHSVFSKVGITEDNIGNYFDTVTFQRSVRFLGLKKKHDQYGIEAVTVLYRVVEREKGGSWNDISETLEAGESQFDSMIDQWVHQRVARIVIIFAHVVLVVAAIAVAWEYGVIQFLVRIGGGARVVLTNIILSTIFELIVHGFTFESFLMGAINGYLGAVFFRGAGGLARGLFGPSITTITLRSGILKWLGLQAFKGIVGGGASGAGFRFVEDVYKIATGQGGWSSPGDYAKSIGFGMAIGVGVEVTGPIILEPVANRIFGGAKDVAKLLLENKVSPARWRAWAAEAQRKISEKTASLLEQQPQKAAVIADGYKAVYDDIGNALDSESEASAPKRPSPKVDKSAQEEEAEAAQQKVAAKPKGKKGTRRGGDQEPVEGGKGKARTATPGTPDVVAEYDNAQETLRNARNEVASLEQRLRSLEQSKDPSAGKRQLQEGLKEELEGAKQDLSNRETEALRAEKALRESTLALHEKLGAAARNRKEFLDVVRLANGEDKVGHFKIDLSKDYIAGDHIVAIRRLTTESRFLRILELSWEEQLEIVNMRDNLVAMKGSWNSSKGARPWSEWPQGREYYGPDIANKMITEEQRIEKLIIDEINKKWDAAQTLKRGRTR
jgi:hypothetical protein